MTPSRGPCFCCPEWVYAAVLLLALLVRRTRMTTATPLAILADILPLLGLPLPVALAGAVLRRDARSAVSLAALGAWWLGLYGPRLRRAPATPRSDAPACTVLSINALVKAHNADRLADMALDAQPDFFAVQELTPSVAGRLTERLAVAYPHHVVAPRRSVAGLGWWSRVPLQDAREVRTAERDPLALLVTADLHGREILLATTHPSIPLLGPLATPRLYDARLRDQQVETLLRALPSRVPTILVGDFNLTDQSAAYVAIAREFRDAFADTGRGLGHTYPTGWPAPGRVLPFPLPWLRLDYVFCRGVTPLDARVLPFVGSDHRPVLANLRLD